MNIRTIAQVLLALCAVALAKAQAAPGAPTPTYATTMHAARAADLLTRVGPGHGLRLQDVWLDGAASPVTLVLERFEVFGPEARITVHHHQGREILKPPGSAYFRGSIEGAPDSIAVLSADASGDLRGIVQSSERFWVLGAISSATADAKAPGFTSRELQQTAATGAARPFQCGVDQLPPQLRSTRTLAPLQAAAPLPPGQAYEVPIAIETDTEFYTKFGSSSAALSYIGNLFAFASTIYSREASTEFRVDSVSLWAGADPWNHSDTLAGLNDFRNYWNANRTATPRALAHFLSGKQLGGGIAYVGALCSSYGYGYSANISGDFSIDNPQTVWDILVVTHEIGHNFGSDHTHEYGGIDGPVDACYQGNVTGVLPGLGSLQGGASGTGAGTIMSYCHLIPPYYSNISMTFGQNHPYGVKAYRVSDAISNYVAQVAAANTSCIGIGSSQKFSLNVTKTGNGVVSSSPVGINCGATCSAPFGDGTRVTLTATPADGYQFSAWGGDCSGQSGATCTVRLTNDSSVTAQFKAASSITLSTSSAAPKYGDDVTLTATVSGSVSGGTVTFKEGTTILGSATVASGKSSLTVSSLAVGTHTLVAAYSGDDSHAGGASSGLSVSVAKRSSTTTLGVSPAAPKYGDAVTLTAVVSGKSPTGAVTFKDGATIIGSGNLANGQAKIVISTLAVGSHGISASYDGDSGHTASSASLSSLNIGKFASITAVGVSPTAPKYGDRIILTATISGKSPSGTVIFKDGLTTVGIATVSSARAVLNITSPAIGTHSFSASYSGDDRHTGSSHAVSVTVAKAATTTTLYASATTATYGAAVTFTASVIGASPTGMVTFRDGATNLGSATLNLGKATLSNASITAGVHRMTAEYSGDARNAGSISVAVAETVHKAPSSTTLSASSAALKYGDSVVLTASVSGKTPSGTVAFSDGAKVLGSAALSSGKAVLAIANLAIGAHTLTASYSSDNNHMGSTSAGLIIRVGKRSSAIALGVSATTPKYGDALTLTAHVSGKSPTGIVAFKDGATVIGSTTLSGGQTAVVISNLGAGFHSLSASYGGDGNHTASSSSAVSVIIGKRASTAALAVSPSAPRYGDGIVITARVGGSSPTGSVTFKDSASILGSGPLAGGQATFATSSLAVGVHSLGASYAGDAGHLGSNSAAIAVTIGKADSSTLLTPSATSLPYGAALLLTAQVLGKSPAGTLTFREGATVLGTRTLSGGGAALSVASLSVGSHTITAAYSGDKNHFASASTAVAVSVTAP